MNAAAPLTPKEYAAEEFGEKRSARWVREQCHEYVRTKGKRGIPVVPGCLRPPYLIPASARGMFSRPMLFEARASRAA